MSHFTVMVIGAGNAEEVDTMLHPFWELDLSREELMKDSRAKFDVEISTEEAMKEYQEFVEKAPTLEQIEYAHKNLLHETGEGFSKNLEAIDKDEWDKWLEENNLDGFSVIYKYDKDFYHSELEGVTDFEKYIQEYHGYDSNPDGDGYGYYNNPNAKWDWYQIGGRWNGYFKVKEGVKVEDESKGESSLMAMISEGYEPPKGNYVDIIRVGDLDFEGMKSDTFEKSAKTWEEAWEEFPEVEDEKTNKGNATSRYFRYGLDTDLSNTKEEKIKYITQQVENCLATFAVVKDGKWYERGDMGWWGLVKDEKEEDSWRAEFNSLLENLPEDTMVTLVDCHI